MKRWRAVAVLALLLIIVVSTLAVYQGYFASPTPACQLIKGGGELRSQLTPTKFGGVTEFRLPGANRWPNAVTATSDGSIWFAEQETPGVAHLYPNNGTLVEYAWPGYPNPKPPDCVPGVNVSGMVVWGGRVWAADEFGNVTVGLNPGDGSVVRVSSAGKAPFPYWLAVGPSGDLWFTSNNFPGQPSRLGRILPNLTLRAIDLAGLGDYQPIQLDFVNSTFALLATISEAQNSTTHACTCTGRIYSFNPSVVGSAVSPRVLGGGYNLVLPTSVSYSNGSVWVAQHGASNLVRYDFGTREWTNYPTSVVPWTDVTLPLGVDTRGNAVWFNEHYANKIARIDPSSGTLTEYSESNPPAKGYQGIQNDLAIASAPAGLWFTSLSGNYVGFVSSSYNPGFHGTVSGNATAKVAPGSKLTFVVSYTGSWNAPMNVSVSDSENVKSTPSDIKIVPSVTTIPTGTSSYELRVAVSVAQGVASGRYTLAVTATEGDVQETAYFFLTVT